MPIIENGRVYYFIFIVPFNLILILAMLWLVMVVSYTQVAGCVIEFFNSLLAYSYKQEGCLVFVAKRFVTSRRIFIGWNPMRRNMQKNVDFFAVGKIMLCVGGGSGAASTIEREDGPLEGADYSLYQVKRSLKWADYSPHQVKPQSLIYVTL
jgi:hypothetical protein